MLNFMVLLDPYKKGSFFLRITFAVIFWVFTGYCNATGTFTWKNPSTNNKWEDPQNWSYSGATNVPVDGDNKVVFTSTDNIIIQISNNIPELNSNQIIGQFIMSSGSLTIGFGYTLNVTNTTNIAGGTTINGSGQLNINQASTLSTTIGSAISGAIINCSVNAIVGTLVLRNNTFGINTTTSFKVTTGATNYVNAIGGNTFNGPITFESTSASGLRLSDLGEDKFNNDLTLITSTSIFTSYNYDTFYKGNIVVKSTGQGVCFGNTATNSTTTSTLEIGKTISASNFIAGTLTLKNFIQLDPTTTQNISLDNGSNLVLVSTTGSTTPQTVFNGPFIVSAGGISLNGVRFKKEANLTSRTFATSLGGNIYEDNAYFTYNANSYTYTWSLNGDIFQKDVTFTNIGTGYLYVGNSGNIIFEGNTTFENKSGGYILIANNSNSIVNFNNTSSKAKFIVGGDRSNIRFAENGTTNFNCDVEVNSTANGSIYSVYSGSGKVYLKAGRKIYVGNALGFNNGILAFRNFIQEGDTEQNLTLDCSTNSASLYFQAGCNFKGNLNATAPTILFQGGTFQGTSDFTCCYSGAAGTFYSQNTEPVLFKGDTYIRNTGTANLALGNGAPSWTFEGNTYFYITGTGNIYLANLSGNTTLFTNPEKKVSVNVSSLNNSVAGPFTFSGSGITRIKSNIEISNNANTTITIGSGSANGSVILEGENIISVPADAFSFGTMKFRNCIQTGTTTQNLTLTGKAIATFDLGSIFNGNLNVIAPNLNFNGSIFNGVSYFEKNGEDNSTGSGGNKFYGTTTTIKNSGTGYLYLGNGVGDNFKDVKLINTSSGGILTCMSGGPHNFEGDIYVESSGTGGVKISAGTSFLATGKRIIAGPFTAGQLYFRNFTQLGDQPQNIKLLESSTFQVQNCVFNGSLTAEAPGMYFQASTFVKTATFTKTGSSLNSIAGGNVFNEDVTIANMGTGDMGMGGDIYYKNCTFIKGSTGVLKPVQTGTGEFYGDLVYNVTSANQNADYLGFLDGLCVFKGDKQQTIFSNKDWIRIDRFKIDKSVNHVNLNCIVLVRNGVTFVKGNIITLLNNYLAFDYNQTITGASNQSFVDGKVRRVGTGTFTFPIGKNGKYRPLTISDPILANSQIFAEYFNESPSGSSYTLPLMDVSECEYWNINAVTANPFSVTLGWDADACTPINPNVISVARNVSGAWKSEGNNNVTANYDIGSVTSNVTNFSGNYN
ncbi:MAG: hypothetical protein J7604_21800, partial [Sporocytophaga sp.]|uniref:beta strand repeat-containing protein n=1 Tax=Sporocytophaga sp. TaxID=2231183 RepID=UPI001B046D29